MQSNPLIENLVADLFDVVASYQQGSHVAFALAPRFDGARASAALRERLTTAGYDFTLDGTELSWLLIIDPRPKLRIPTLNILLFVLTLLSVYVVPIFLSALTQSMLFIAQHVQAPLEGILDEFRLMALAAPPAWSRTLERMANGDGLEFTLAIISILFIHEMGHFVAGRRRHVVTSWPYFIPAPNIIGTFGAIIKSKSPFWNRRDLIEVGAAGPIAGWIVAVFWLIFGLTRSHILPNDAFTPEMIGFSLDGESILMRLATLSTLGVAPDGFSYHLSEGAFAGWVGLLVTAINLLPIGQLDGGHILYGTARRLQHTFAIIALGSLFVLGFLSQMWWVFAVMGLIFGIKHPPTLNDGVAPSRVAVGMAVASLVIFGLSFTPIPFR